MHRYILARVTAPFLVGVLPCLLAGFFFAASCRSATAEAADKSIDELIADLGSDRFEVRETAMCALKERLDAVPALQKARQSGDLEIRLRVDEILATLKRRPGLLSLAKAKALGKAGRAVEVADRLAFAATCGADGEAGWDSLMQLADRVITRADSYFSPGWKFSRTRGFPAGEYRRYVEIVHPTDFARTRIEIDTGASLDFPTDVKRMAGRKFIRDNYGKLLLRGEEVSLTGGPLWLLSDGMIASSAGVQITTAVGSVIVAGGDITKVSGPKSLGLMCCILICDGDVEMLSGWGTHGTIIVARGKVTWKEGRITNCLIRSGHTLHMPDGKTIDLKDGTPDPLAFVKFFELADVGLAAEDLPKREKSAAEGVRLKEVKKDSPFAAGLRSGDVITAIEERKTPTTEIFRRVLRRKLARWGPTITFTVRRSDKTLDVPIPVKD